MYRSCAEIKNLLQNVYWTPGWVRIDDVKHEVREVLSKIHSD